MIVDLCLRGRTILIVGGGNQAQKRIGTLLHHDTNAQYDKCRIIVMSTRMTPQICAWIQEKKIELVQKDVTTSNVLSIMQMNPDIVIAATDNGTINKMIVNASSDTSHQGWGILTYSVDDPTQSHFANPAVIDIDGMIQVAIFTGGRSPTISKRIKGMIEPIIRETVGAHEIAQIKIQQIARTKAMELIPDVPKERAECMRSIMYDPDIDKMIKDGRLQEAEDLAVSMVRKWRQR